MTVVATAVAKIILAMAIGYFLYKIKIFNDGINKSLSALVVQATCPCMIFNAIVSMESSGEEAANVGRLMIVGLGVYVLLFIIAVIATWLLKPGHDLKTIYWNLMIFGNAGFLGFPIAQSLYGKTGIFYMALLNIHFNLLCYTAGYIWSNSGSQGAGGINIKKIINPCSISAILALILFLLKVKLPEIVMTPISFIGQITSPLAMITVGSMAAALPLKEVFGNWRFYVMLMVKMAVAPLAAFFLMKLIFGLDVMAAIIVIYTGLPAAAAISMMAPAGSKAGKTAAGCTAFMNICCVITIAVQYMLLGKFI